MNELHVVIQRRVRRYQKG